MKYVAIPLSLLEILSTVAIEPVTKLFPSAAALLLALVILGLVILGVGNPEKRLANFCFSFLATVLGSWNGIDVGFAPSGNGGYIGVVSS